MSSSAYKGLRIAVSGGGTGGHVIPALLISKRICELKPDTEIIYIGAKVSIEERLAGEAGYKFCSVWISFLKRGSLIANLALPLKCLVALIQAISYLQKYKVDLVIGTGGFSAWPACTAARICRKPYFLQEQNAIPGLVTRLSAKGAARIYLGYNEAANRLKVRESVLLHTGNPVHLKIGAMKKTEAAQRLGLDTENPTLLITGGSAGAASINKAIDESKKQILSRGLNLIWQTGRNWDGDMEVPEELSDRMIMQRFFDIEKMSLVYDASDLAVTRCGAMTLAELAAAGLPAVLVPYPYAADGHQEKNARAVESAGAAMMILDKDLDSKVLIDAIEMIAQKEKRTEMAAAMQEIAMIDAVDRIAEDIIGFVE
ncbi:MAG: undecaprenyldiphospho-muramoylpentapeptide beta-N-acetylglucosaminyltransferase [Calditrichaeota bacterium]|nr:undecaprenyldiphospho-muramoylpentapeptide beta-N-acetylglucosaminyltransferase [Calditrichota bacterium]